MNKTIKAVCNFFFCDGLYGAYQFIVLFILIFSAIRMYPILYGGSYFKRVDPVIHNTMVLLLVVVFAAGSIATIVVAQAPFPFEKPQSAHVRINGQVYEVAKYGDKYSVNKGTDNSGLSYLLLRTLFSIALIPFNILFLLIKFIGILTIKKLRFDYSSISIRTYWVRLLNLHIASKIRIIYSHSFAFVEIVTGVILISMTYNIA